MQDVFQLVLMAIGDLEVFWFRKKVMLPLNSAVCLFNFLVMSDLVKCQRVAAFLTGECHSQDLDL